MKIGLLSVQNHNYGSILQAYALQQFLNNMGNEAEIIRYKKTNLIKQASRLFYYPLFKATVKMKWKNIYCKVFKKKECSQTLNSRERAFSAFIDKNIRVSKLYVGRKELEKSYQDYDVFVLGSDQVWNPMNLGGDFFTMTFVPDHVRKITYAPSFGVSEIPKNQRKKTAAYLSRIDKIAVREKDGIRIIKELTGRDVTTVVDPTILIDRSVWDQQTSERMVKEDYIFCYFISTNPAYRAFAKRLSEKTGLKVVGIPHVDEYVKADVGFGDIIPDGVGPLEFVNLIRNAYYVCTDSFHGSVFSTLYHKTYFTFSRYAKEGGDSTNSRLYSFLEMIGLEKRLTNPEQEITDVLLQKIDYQNTDAILKKIRADSIKYLETALAE